MYYFLLFFIYRSAKHPVLSQGFSGLDLLCTLSSGSLWFLPPSSPWSLNGLSVLCSIKYIYLWKQRWELIQGSLWIFWLFSPQVVVLMGLVLQSANLYGYVRCKMGEKSNLKAMAKNYIGVQMLTQVFLTLYTLSWFYTQNVWFHFSFLLLFPLSQALRRRGAEVEENQ